MKNKKHDGYIEIHSQSNSDTYRALVVYYGDGEKWLDGDYGTIGEAARDLFSMGLLIYNCTGGKTSTRRNLITRTRAESGEIG